jgi:hypothetical protein
MKSPKGSEHVVPAAMLSMLTMTLAMVPKHQRKKVAIQALLDPGLPFGDEERENAIRAIDDPNSHTWRQIEQEITRSANDRFRDEIIARDRIRQETWRKKTWLQKLIYMISIVLLCLLTLVVSFAILLATI